MPSLKRPNPITWQTPPKKARVADASDESPADSADARQDRQAGSASASRAASSKQPQPSPAKGGCPSTALCICRGNVIHIELIEATMAIGWCFLVESRWPMCLGMLTLVADIV